MPCCSRDGTVNCLEEAAELQLGQGRLIVRLHHLRDRDACTPETVDNLVCAQRAAPVRDVAIEGFVVLSPPSLAQLRAFAAAAGLAAHKLPARLVIVDDFPRTSAGKVHKRALPTLLA